MKKVVAVFYQGNVAFVAMSRKEATNITHYPGKQSTKQDEMEYTMLKHYYFKKKLDYNLSSLRKVYQYWKWSTNILNQREYSSLRITQEGGNKDGKNI